MTYSNKSLSGGHQTYSSSIRSDILPLVDQNYSRVLDIGCSSGNTGVMLKEYGLCDYVIGVEPFEETSEMAKQRLDQVIVKPVEDAIHDVPDESIDCVMCLDVLEHLVDPWTVIKQLGAKVKCGGVIICSIPNVRHVSVLFNLIILGRWTYTDMGILDKTHLRFFTRSTIIELSSIQGFHLEVIRGHIGKKSRLLNYLTLGVFRNFLYGQHQIRIRKL